MPLNTDSDGRSTYSNSSTINNLSLHTGYHSERPSPSLCYQHQQNHLPPMHHRHRLPSSSTEMIIPSPSARILSAPPPPVSHYPLSPLPSPISEPCYRYATTSQKGFDRGQVSRYALSVCQQPHRARMVGSGEKADRRPIDPPPVLRFQVFNQPPSSPASGADLTLMRSPYYICFGTLCESKSPHAELLSMPDTKKAYLAGSNVASVFQLREGQSKVPDGHYFVFSDLGVRVEGKYRLKFSVYEIVEQKAYHCISTMTDQFEVFTAKRFPGMDQSTEVSKTFAHQGFRLRVRSKIARHTPPTYPVHKRTGTASSINSSRKPKVAGKPVKTQQVARVMNKHIKLPPPPVEVEETKQVDLLRQEFSPSSCSTVGSPKVATKNFCSLPSVQSMLEGVLPDSSDPNRSILNSLRQIDHRHNPPLTRP